jgi:hypothetical protein
MSAAKRAYHNLDVQVVWVAVVVVLVKKRVKVLIKTQSKPTLLPWPLINTDSP